MHLRYIGQDDPVAAKIFRVAASRAEEEISAPADTSITTLYIGNLAAGISEEDLMKKLYVYGEILALRINPQKHVAFVCYANREAAVNAIQQLGGQLYINGACMRVAWAKPKPKQQQQTDSNSTSSSSSSSSSSSAAPVAVPDGYLAPPMPGLPAVQLPPGMAAPPPAAAAAASAAAPYRSMRPFEAELSKR